MTTTITQGWDLIAAITGTALNTLLDDLYNDGVLPSSFTQPINSGIFVSVTADIAAPTVNLNPISTSGPNLQAAITLPFTSGTIDTVAGSYAFPLTTSVTITTDLQYVKVDVTGGTNAKLMLDFTSPYAVAQCSVKQQDPTDWDDHFDPVIASALLTFLRSNLPASLILGSINLASAAQALQPVGAIDFAIQTNQPDGDNTLLLLATTSTGSAGDTDFSASPAILSAGQPAAFYISNRVLIENVLIPQLASSFGVDASTFSVNGSSSQPYTATWNGSQQLPGKDNPQLVGLNVAVNANGQLEIDYDVHGAPDLDIDDAYYVDVNGSVFITPTLTQNTQTLTFNVDTPAAGGTLETSLLGKVMVIAAIVATFGTLGAFLAAVAADIVLLVTEAFTITIDFPSTLTASINGVMTSFVWPAQSTIPLTSIALPGDLVIVAAPAD